MNGWWKENRSYQENHILVLYSKIDMIGKWSDGCRRLGKPLFLISSGVGILRILRGVSLFEWKKWRETAWKWKVTC